MTPAHSTLDQSTTYIGKNYVIVRNGASLPLTHTGKISSSPNLYLLDVLVIPHLTKNLLSINKLTHDFSLSVTFTNNFSLFRIAKREGWWQPVKDMDAYMC